MPATIVEFPGARDVAQAADALADRAEALGRTEGLLLAHGLAVAEFDRLCAERPHNMPAIDAASRICSAIFEACMAGARHG